MNHWIVTDPALLGGNVAGLKTPDAVTALVLDGYATDNGRTFEYPPFEAGRQDAVFMVLPAPVGQRVYENLSRYIAGRKSLKENLDDENEVLGALWALGEDRVAVLVADCGGSDHAQQALERILSFERHPLQRSDLAVIASGFDAARLLSENRSIYSEQARQALVALLPLSPRPVPPRGPRLG